MIQESEVIRTDVQLTFPRLNRQGETNVWSVLCSTHDMLHDNVFHSVLCQSSHWTDAAPFLGKAQIR